MGRIVVMSDTMISDEHFIRQRNAIPGRLKSIVINEWLTVSYSGLSTQALDAIRELASHRCLSTAGVIDFLQNTSVRDDGEIDFLMCSHENTASPRLVKISAAHVSEGQDMYWIGNADSARLLARLEVQHAVGESGGEFFSLEETRFTRRFHEYIGRSGDRDVGGMGINCLASPFGHCYQDHCGVSADELTIPDPLSPALRASLDKAGTNGYYKYAVVTSPQRGDALVGVYFEQAGIGYVHQPLLLDDPEKVEVTSQEEFQLLIGQRARASCHASSTR